MEKTFIIKQQQADMVFAQLENLWRLYELNTADALNVKAKQVKPLEEKAQLLYDKKSSMTKEEYESTMQSIGESIKQLEDYIKDLNFRASRWYGIYLELKMSIMHLGLEEQYNQYKYDMKQKVVK